VRALASLALAAVLSAAAGQERPTLFMVGDSTMATRVDAERNPEHGWGEMLPRFLDGGVTVRNAAMNGRSSKSFIDEGRWAAVLAAISPGDCVLVQFGHNDEKREDPARYTDPHTAYRANLLRFVAEARQKGAAVVIASPIVRRRFSAAGVLEDTHGEYPAVAEQVARETGAPFLDLQRLSRGLVEAAGVEGSKSLYVWLEPRESAAFPQGRQDNTHLSARGAAEVARLAAEALRGTGLPIARHVLTDG
jgi:lysophospholipase L1-like esterase